MQCRVNSVDAERFIINLNHDESLIDGKLEDLKNNRICVRDASGSKC